MAGVSATVFGRGFPPSDPNITCTLGGTRMNVTVLSAEIATFNVPVTISLGTASLTLSSPLVASNETAGYTLTLRGKDFPVDDSSIVLVMPALIAPVPLTVINSTYALAPLPPDSLVEGLYNISVMSDTIAERAMPVSFEVLGAVYMRSISPAVVVDQWDGVVLDIVGGNMLATDTNVSLSIGTAPIPRSSYTFNSTHMRVTIPSNLTRQRGKVDVVFEGLLMGKFNFSSALRVVAPPIILNFDYGVISNRSRETIRLFVDADPEYLHYFRPEIVWGSAGPALESLRYPESNDTILFDVPAGAPVGLWDLMLASSMGTSARIPAAVRVFDGPKLVISSVSDYVVSSTIATRVWATLNCSSSSPCYSNALVNATVFLGDIETRDVRLEQGFNATVGFTIMEGAPLGTYELKVRSSLPRPC
eukprot:tig00021234_g19424.t1